MASLSILELLEYNLERSEINYALSERVIAIDKTSSHSLSSQLHPTETMREDSILLRNLRYNNTNLYIQIKQGVSYFCDRMTRNLKDTDRAAIVPSQEEQSAMIKELYDVVTYML